MPPGRFEGGRILFRGEDLGAKSDDELRAIRGNEIAMIFQEPMTSLNPVFTVGEQIDETVLMHQGLDGAGGARARRSRCSPGRHPRPREARSTSIRTSSRAACASA